MAVVGHDVDISALHVHPDLLSKGPQKDFGIAAIICIVPSIVRVTCVCRIIQPRSTRNFLIEVILFVVSNINFKSLESVLFLRVAVECPK